MEEDEIIHHSQACKFPRVGNGRNIDSNNKYSNHDQELLEQDEGGGGGRRVGCDDVSTNTILNSRLSSWHNHSSRIIRVSRASGGKDRHSKVMTSKGLRDRRVRLSVTTAIQFYDLQDRLGYDQPSKAVEWLIKSASDAISELPSLNNTFPDTPKQRSDEKKRASVEITTTEQGFDYSADHIENGTENNNNYHHNQNQNNNNLSLSKSACSSTSETSKGSGLSLSRSDIRVNRVKARERARERTAKEKEKENDQSHNNNNNNNNNNSNIVHHHQNVNSISQTASFTELLTGGINNTCSSPRGSVHQGGDEANLFHKATRQQWNSAVPMDYFSPVLLGTSSSRTHHHHHHQQTTSPSGFSLSQIQLGHSSHSLSDNAMSMSFSSGENENHHQHHHSSDQLQQQQQQQQHYSFIPHEHLHLMQQAPTAVVSSSSQPTGNNEYNLNFSISSSGLAGYNRGTLQSNSPSLLPHLQRFSTLDGSSISTVPFFMGGAAAPPPPASAAPTTMENNHHHQQQHHQFSSVFDGSRLHLCYGDGCRHSDQKGKAKN